MDVVRRILAEAADHLTEEGFIVVEVGDGLEAVEAAFPVCPLRGFRSRAATIRYFSRSAPISLNISKLNTDFCIRIP